MRTSLGALFCLVSTQSLASAATLTVTTTSDLGSGSLRDAIRRAQDGDTIVFAPGIMGTITLDAVLEIRSSLTIAGPGASQLAISGDGAFRVFDLNEGHSVSISGLTITRGQSVEGSALRNHGSALRLADDVFIDNEAGGQYAAGGAIANYNRADLTITGCTFIGNRAMGKDGGGWARGGAIVNQRSSATISGSVFIGNEAAGGAGGQNRYGGFGPGLGAGGAIDNIDGASLTVLNCTFTDNHAAGGDRGDGGEHAALVGEGQGGALRNHDTSTLLLSGSWLSGNVATGGSSTTASGPARLGTARGGAIFNHGSARVVNSTFAGNEAVGGDGGMGSNATRENGTAVGGAILNSGAFDTVLIAENVTLIDNQAQGGAGNVGGSLLGTGMGGGVTSLYRGAPATATITNSSIRGNRASGGRGATGGSSGDGFGGGTFNSPETALTILASTITENAAVGGLAPPGGSAGLGIGGGVYFSGGAIVCVDERASISLNTASTSDDEVFGQITTCQ